MPCVPERPSTASRYVGVRHTIVLLTFACLAAELATPLVAVAQHDWLYAGLLGGRFLLPRHGRLGLVIHLSARLIIGVYGAFTDRLGLAIAGTLVSFVFLGSMELWRFMALRQRAKSAPSSSSRA